MIVSSTSKWTLYDAKKKLTLSSYLGSASREDLAGPDVSLPLEDEIRGSAPYLELLPAVGRVAQQRLGGRRVYGHRLLGAAVFAAGLVVVVVLLVVMLPTSLSAGTENRETSVIFLQTQSIIIS